MVLVGVLMLARHSVRQRLGHPAFGTGWVLITVMLFLAMYGSRKRLSMLPIGRASTWLLFHVVGGATAVCVFWFHAGRLWPKGGYLQVLALLFYLVSLSGICGWLLQMIYPRRLTGSGVEIIYERIPAELANLREQAEAIVMNCTRETGSTTLADHYLEKIDWFLRRPRFYFYNAIGSERARTWHRQQHDQVQRYLDSHERKFLEELSAIIDYKLKLDFHYAAQSVMKGWLLFHVPLSAALLFLSFWHILVVYIYVA